MTELFVIINRPLRELFNPNYTLSDTFSERQLIDIISYILATPYVEEKQPRIFIETNTSRSIGPELTWFQPFELAEVLTKEESASLIITSIFDFSPIDYYDFTASQHSAIAVAKGNAAFSLELNEKNTSVSGVGKDGAFGSANCIYIKDVNQFKRSANFTELFQRDIFDAYMVDQFYNLAELEDTDLNIQLGQFRTAVNDLREQNSVLRKYKEIIEESDTKGQDTP